MKQRVILAERTYISSARILAYFFIAILYTIGLNFTFFRPTVDISTDRFSETSVRSKESVVEEVKDIYQDPQLAHEIAATKFHRSFIPDRDVPSTNRPIILTWTKKYDVKSWWQNEGAKNVFEEQNCPHICEFTTDKNLLERSDMLLIQGWKECHLNSDATNGISCVGWDEPFEIWEWPHRKTRGQVWVYFNLESQLNTASGSRLAFARNMFNYTITFKSNSDMHYPYGFSTEFINPQPNELKKYRADTKSKLLLWIVSHCQVPLRDEYANELRKHIKLDEFGRCSGNHDGCDRNNATCIQIVKSQYKFYMAFENSICENYITEKFWDSLIAGLVPVVLGPSIEEYKAAAPPHSFIHVDDFSSPKALADYLLYLDSHDEEYNAYHSWREHYRITPGWFTQICELCRLATLKPKRTVNLSKWWSMEAECKNYTANNFIKEVAQSLDNVINI